jgi:hypothetical protein
MRKIFVLCLSTLVFAGAVIVPAGFAAEQTEFTATDYFNPLPLPGFGPQIGELLSPPTIHCPGDAPTGNPAQPCPDGSRMHSRDAVAVTRLVADDPRMTGWLTVTLNSNLDASLEGPSWGTFRLDVDDDGGVWEGTWHGYRTAYDGYWVGEIHGQGKGYGGIVDGLKMMGEEQIMLVTPLPLAYIGTWQGRIIDPN